MKLDRARIGLILAPLAAAIVTLAPLSDPGTHPGPPLTPEAHRLAAIFVAVVIAWITECIPIAVTALLVAPLMILFGVTNARAAFSPYADPLLFLFVGGFMIAAAMQRHGLDRRIALGLVSSRFVAGRPARVRAAFVFAAISLSMWISNTATCAILVPIVLGTQDDLDQRDILTIAYACSIGGMGTLVGSPPNAITARLLGEAGYEIGFLTFSALGLPTVILMSVALLVLMRRNGTLAAEVPPPKERAFTRGELNVALAFALAVAGWVIPGLLRASDAEIAPAVSRALPGGGVALLAASTLFMTRDEKGEMTLPWPEAAKIDWGIIMLFGGGIALGKQMFHTGLAAAMSHAFVEFTGVADLATLTVVVAVFTIFFTEVCSNTASSNMLVPLVIAAATEIGVSPVPPALAVGLAASCAFMLPIATGPNAIVYGTGRVTMPTMMRSGFALNIAGALIVCAVLWILCPWLGLTEIVDPPPEAQTTELAAPG